MYEIMKKSLGYIDRTPGLSLTALATLCFVTLILCQTRFKITKEISREMYPPALRSKDCWFLYSIGNPDRFKCVLRAFIVISSPVLSLVSTGLLLLGKIESNPYFFIPWLFLTMKGLLLVQTDNLLSILRDVGSRANYAFGFRLEDLKWLLFYFTIFLVDLLEAVSFYEIFDLFLVLWNHHPGYDLDSAKMEAVKRDIVEIMETLSKCSLGSLSKMSLGSFTESDNTNMENEFDEVKNTVKFSLKDEKKLFDARSPVASLSKGEPIENNSLNQSILMGNYGGEYEENDKEQEMMDILSGSDEMPTSDSSEVPIAEKSIADNNLNGEKQSVSTKETVKTSSAPKI